MNYIELNGLRSTDLDGLLIQTLPPISKPLVRTQVDEIDGRDGDIVTKLGYAAYDKEFTIGLHGTFFINDIIAFFNTSGTVIFSNEADKVYRYEIIEQIDFEKLLRYRTATVKMHVQPFKFPATGNRIEESTNPSSIRLYNTGNVISKPKLTIRGTGAIEVRLNGYGLFNITLGQTEEEITIDAESMEAYNESTGALMNRQVVGSYELFYLPVGTNDFVFNGTVSFVAIENFTRWL